MTIKHELHVKQAKSAELLEAASPIAREDTTNMCTPPPLCRQGLGTRDNLDIGNDIMESRGGDRGRRGLMQRR